MEIDVYDLKAMAAELGAQFPAIDALYLFGSRRYRTRSRRSDLDVLVAAAGFVQPGALRSFTSLNCPALDLFQVAGNRAVSCANESFVEAATFAELVKQLGAVEFWNRKDGVLAAADVDWKVEVQRGVSFPPTFMGSTQPFAAWVPAIKTLFKQVERDGIPVRPYIGPEIRDWADFLADFLRRAVAASYELRAWGRGDSLTLNDEYDFQNLFFLAVKPWLPGLERESVAVIFDGQKKVADFNIGASRILVELKFVKDANTKAAVVKTLAGLKDFYSVNANVRLLIFCIVVAPGAGVDGPKWEYDFSSSHSEVMVRTVVVPLPD